MRNIIGIIMKKIIFIIDYFEIILIMIFCKIIFKYPTKNLFYQLIKKISLIYIKNKEQKVFQQ